MISRMPGRNILTTTSSPPLSVAACTCAIEAAASGVSSKNAKISASGRPNVDSIVATAILPSNGGTWSCSSASSSAMSTGSKSRRVDNAWPNFTNMGPSSSSASRNRIPRVVPALR